MSVLTGVRVRRRKYGFCAKGGHEKPLNTRYVCSDHAGSGQYTNCANCGVELNEGRDYVCEECLA